MKVQLDQAIDKYIAPLGKKYGFTSINEETYGMGALHDYEADNLFIRIVNDKGIIEVVVAPKGHPEKQWDVTIFKEYLEPPKKGVLNLSLLEQSEFLDTHWAWLNEALSESKYKETLKEINKVGKKRSDILFGN